MGSHKKASSSCLPRTRSTSVLRPAISFRIPFQLLHFISCREGISLKTSRPVLNHLPDLGFNHERQLSPENTLNKRLASRNIVPHPLSIAALHILQRGNQLEDLKTAAQSLA
eukprot:TRINITY_DN46_c0_g1_i1.p1 TRINITY_DN46_c0_g1~~TRINITY_DN46_c0_g1_i1.p1  ORF type:complete len:112 (-),score=8.44 TRINITY_DN46_c0_g1_i1:279-614(-)